MPELEWVLIFLLLGTFVGFMAGLLGIGGGGIMVPILTTIFLALGVSLDNVVHLALGTSMAAIIITSLSSLRTHHAMNAVSWLIVRQMVPGILIGTFLATFIAPHVSSLYLAIFFSLFMFFVAIQLLIGAQPKPSRKIQGQANVILAGSGIGSISALVSIGGGSLTVPYLLWHNITLKHAIGTSAAIGFPLSIAGTLGYVINGWESNINQDFTFGFVYLPAVILISATSYFTAPYGAKCAHKLPIMTVKKIFSVLLILLSLKMLFSII